MDLFLFIVTRRTVGTTKHSLAYIFNLKNGEQRNESSPYSECVLSPSNHIKGSATIIA